MRGRSRGNLQITQRVSACLHPKPVGLPSCSFFIPSCGCIISKPSSRDMVIKVRHSLTQHIMGNRRWRMWWLFIFILTNQGYYWKTAMCRWLVVRSFSLQFDTSVLWPYNWVISSNIIVAVTCWWEVLIVANCRKMLNYKFQTYKHSYGISS